MLGEIVHLERIEILQYRIQQYLLQQAHKARENLKPHDRKLAKNQNLE